MGKLEEIRDTAIRSIKDISVTFIDELNELISNVRWLASLATAEIGGLAAYRELLAKENLSISFAFVILIISISLLFFIISAILSRINKVQIQRIKNAYNTNINKISETTSESIDEIEKKINKEPRSFVQIVQTKTLLAKKFEIFGIGLLGISTLIATIAIFFQEIKCLFCGCN